MADLEWKQGEVKTVTLSYGSSIEGSDLSNATLSMDLKESIDSSIIIASLVDSDFNKGAAESDNVITAVFDSTITDRSGSYVFDIKTVFESGVNEDKSQTFSLMLDKSVTE